MNSLPTTFHRTKRRQRGSRRAYCRRSRASEKRCTGNFGARTGHRSYNTDSGRWLNRDPLGELGFKEVFTRFGKIRGEGYSLYLFVANFPIGLIDVVGLYGNPICGLGQCYPSQPWNPPPPDPPAYLPGTNIPIPTDPATLASNINAWLRGNPTAPCPNGFPPGLNIGHYNHCMFGCLFTGATGFFGGPFVGLTEFGFSTFQWGDLFWDYYGAVAATLALVNPPISVNLCNNACAFGICKSGTTCSYGVPLSNVNAPPNISIPLN